MIDGLYPALMAYLYPGLKVLHLVCAVLWVGGMFFTYVVLRPALAAIEAQQRMLLQTQVFRRFFRLVWHVMPLVLLTGIGMTALLVVAAGRVPAWPIHAMAALGLVMSAVFVALVLGPYKQFRRTINRDRMAASLNTIRKLIGLNLLLGLLTLVIAGLL
jgi:hypothetical protein